MSRRIKWFNWLTGEPWNYTNWGTVFPDTAVGSDYVQIRGGDQGKWFAVDGWANAFVVEKPCCIGQSGNVDHDPDELVDIGDVTALISYLYIPPNPEPSCVSEANVDGDPSGIIDIGDLTALIGYLYVSPNPELADCPSYLVPPSDTVILMDATGVQWDISQAVHYYDLRPNLFGFGVGPEAFPPILNPNFIEPGDSGYPGPDETFSVLGITFDGESRAYALSDLVGHEVADDQFDTTFVAAAY